MGNTAVNDTGEYEEWCNAVSYSSADVDSIVSNNIWNTLLLTKEIQQLYKVWL